MALTLVFNGHPVAGGSLTLVTLGRIWCLRQRRFWWLTLGVCCTAGLWFGWHQGQLQGLRLSPTRAMAWTTTLRVQPDDLHFRGNRYRVIGQQPDGERLVVSGIARTAADYQRLRQLAGPTLWTARGDKQGLLPAPNLNQFDGAAYWGHRGIANTLRLTAPPQIRPASSSGWQRWSDWWHRQRVRLIRACEHLPGALRVYALGLFPGIRAPEAATELMGMQRLGIIHLFAISGLHVTLWLTVGEWMAVHLRLPREWWEWGLVFFLPGYAILAGGGSGVTRACWMRGVQLMGQRLGRLPDALTGWTVALMVGLLTNPGLLVELGGQLSYGLSLGLILLRRETPRWRQVGLLLLGLPVLLYGIFQWHVLTLAANWLVVPLFSVVLLPVTVVGTVLGLWLPEVAAGCARLLGAFDAVLTWAAQLPGNVVFGRPPWWLALAWVGLTWWVFSRPVSRRRTWLVVLGVSYGLAFGIIHHPPTGEVSFFDVGQGDSILIREAGNRRVSLIDVGGRLTVPQPPWAPRTPVSYGAQATVVAYLQSRGIRHLDAVYLTHHDADHIGDLPAILANFEVATIYVPAGMETEAAWQRHLPLAVRQRVRPLQVGDAAALRVWHPLTPGVADNGGSLALQGQFGGRRFLFMGDLDQAGERQMMALAPTLRTDVLKVGHHGSDTATAPEFVAQLRPALAIISSGRHNRYGHPSPITQATLAQQQIPVLNTQERGMIQYTYWGQRGWWTTALNLKEEPPE